MPRVNLLPWRDEIRRDRERRFYISMATAAVAVILIVGVVQLYIGGLVSNQEELNGILEQEIAVLDKKIREIKELQAKKDTLLARMNVIQNLQATRPLSVHMFDEIARRLPPGIFLSSLVQKGNNLILEGSAQSNARVSAFMRNIEESDWVADPQLNVIRSKSDKAGKVRSFTLRLKLKQKKVALDEDGEDA